MARGGGRWRPPADPGGQATGPESQGDVAVQAAGGTFADIARLNVYVVDWAPEKMAALGEGATRAAGSAAIDPLKPITLMGVAALGEPHLLIEVEATAVVN